MRYSYTGKGTVVSQGLKNKTEQKIGRLERLLPEDAEVHVTFTVVKLENRVEVTIPLQRRILRAEVTDTDMYAAIDQVVDILESQMVRYKERLKDKARRDISFKEELTYHFSDDDGDEGADGVSIQKTKKFALKPMDAEEAVMNMELLAHSFFVFRNAETDEVNVVYKRKDSTYGLIEPEY